MKYLNISYGDLMKMPTYERRFFIVTLQNQINKTEEESENTPKVTKTGKFTSTRSYSPK
jgi:hypothetical protein